MDKVKKMILDAKCDVWRQMLESGKLYEVRMDISRYFSICYDGMAIEDAYNELQDAQKKGVNTSYTRCLLDKIMYDIMAYHWGSEVADKVIACL